MMYTNEEINEYRAGWLETHPDEVLDDYTVISCLEDEERAAMVDALIADDLETNFNTDFIERVLREGHDGYEHMTTIDLRDEVKTRGLKL